MKLHDLHSNPYTYHVIHKSYFEVIIYDDDLKVVCYGSPSVVAAFITKYLKKTDTIFYYNSRKDDFTYAMTSMYVGAKPGAKKSKQTQAGDAVKQSDKKPAS